MSEIDRLAAVAAEEVQAIPDTVVRYMDKRLEDMTREELIDAIRHLGKEVKSAHEQHRQTLNMWASLRKNA